MAMNPGGGGFSYEAGYSSHPGPPPAYTDPTVAQPAPTMNPQMMMGMAMGMANMMQATPQALVASSTIPVVLQCPFCHANTTTVVDRRVGSQTYLGIVLCTCLCCCCLIPCNWNNMKEAWHSCGNCQKEIGRFEPSSRHQRHY